MAQQTKPAPFRWADTGSNLSMDTTKKNLGWVAEKPKYQQMNWLFQQITQHLMHINEHGIGVWDSATDYANLALARSPANGGIYFRVAAAGVGGGEPSITPANWAAYGSPAGEIKMFAMSTAPAGYLKANGALVSRTTYAALFAAISTAYGAGDGSTTFALPDLRGEFVRGWDDARGVDAGRAIGTAQSSDVGPHTHGISLDKGESDASGSGSDLRYLGTPEVTITTNANTGVDTRPRNIAMLYCIKY
jgi:microcystin-dependent protein